MKIGVTGHRPERLKNKKDVECWLMEQIKNFQGCNDDVDLITGMAEGVDQMAALAARKCGAGIICYFPYKRKLRLMEEYLAESAKEIRYITDKYRDGCFFERDRRIVDDSDVLLVVWDGRKIGGTWYTYKYALEQGKDVLVFPWKN